MNQLGSVKQFSSVEVSQDKQIINEVILGIKDIKI